eukprot:m.186506 g.186506  ORF g.186506 m.186506 type:complete len:401 (-) comp15055_c0_seq1:1461-2663(-)
MLKHTLADLSGEADIGRTRPAIARVNRSLWFLPRAIGRLEPRSWVERVHRQPLNRLAVVSSAERSGVPHVRDGAAGGGGAQRRIVGCCDVRDGGVALGVHAGHGRDTWSSRRGWRWGWEQDGDPGLEITVDVVKLRPKLPERRVEHAHPECYGNPTLGPPAFHAPRPPPDVSIRSPVLPLLIVKGPHPRPVKLGPLGRSCLNANKKVCKAVFDRFERSVPRGGRSLVEPKQRKVRGVEEIGDGVGVLLVERGFPSPVRRVGRRDRRGSAPPCMRELFAEGAPGPFAELPSEEALDRGGQPLPVQRGVVHPDQKRQWENDPGALHRNPIRGGDPLCGVIVHHGGQAGLSSLEQRCKAALRVAPEVDCPDVALVVRREVCTPGAVVDFAPALGGVKRGGVHH